MKVKCNKAFTNPWECVHCAHARAHKPQNIRKATKEALLCHEFRDYCFGTDQWVKCEPVTD